LRNEMAAVSFARDGLRHLPIFLDCQYQSLPASIADASRRMLT
jgi:hypothetical protein